MSWIKFRGVKCTDVGLMVEKMPEPPKPKRNIERFQVPGRDGEQVIWDGTYKDIRLVAVLNLFGQASFDTAIAWMAGEGDLVMSDHPERCYRMRIDEEVKFKRYRPGDRNFDSAQITFDGSPFRYESTPAIHTIDGLKGGEIIQNPGTIASDPLITITGNGDITFMISGKMLMIDDVQGSVVIDVGAGVTYKPGNPKVLWTLKTTPLGDEWPTMDPGDNAVSWTGNISEVKIQPNWRWI